jgi:MFS family permease
VSQPLQPKAPAASADEVPETCSASAAPVRPGRAGWVAETVLLGSGVFANIASSVLIPALPLIEDSFAGEPDAALLTKMIVSAASIATIFVSMFAGALVARFGRRRVLIAAYGVFVVAGVAGMWLPSLVAIIVSRVFVGAAGALIVALGITLIGDFYDAAPRDRRIGVSHAVGALLIGLLVPFAGYLSDFDWRWAFLIHLFGLPLLACVVASRDLERLDARMAERRAEARPRARIPPLVWALGALTLCAGMVGYSSQIYAPFHLRHIGAYTGAAAGVMFAVSLMSSVVSSILYAEVRRWLSPLALFGLVFIGWSAGLALLAQSHDLVSAGWAMAVIGFAGGALGPNLFSVVSAITSEEARPHSVGLIKGIYFSGPFVGPAAMQLIYQRNGVDAALVTLAAIAAGVFVVCAILAVRHRPKGVLI